ncbi:MAG: diguanylate cyclase [Spirochaetales bacterium]|nr:diguanylate cyclase [Spirochaetales bacterium]
MERVNLLIVDDESEYLDQMVEILREEGYSIFTAPSGDGALAVMQKENIDIVLLDILMGGMTGYEVCKEIRKRYNTKPMQIVLITGLTEDHYLEQAIEVGGDDFIHKPITPIELQRRIKAAVIRLRSQKKLFSEREHLKETVIEKEKFSNKVLDQHKTLKKEYETIKKMNVELTTSNKELKIIARFDMLSGLLNRMSLFDQIDKEIERSVRSGTTLTGIMLDIDHFKNINDNFGHQVGDMVIKALGDMLRKSLRKYDYAGRYGGEEFYMVLTSANLQQGFIIGERFRREMEENPINCAGKEVHVTVSMGIAQYRTGESRDSWIQRADKAMYKAKKLGRNRIVLE